MSKSRIGRLFLFFSIAVFGQANAQSYYYIESSLNTTGNDHQKFFTFLILSPDGTATSRTLYRTPATGQQKLVEQWFVDSTETIATNDDTKKYLYPSGDALYINTADDSSFIQPRYVFKKQKDGENIFYIPDGIEQKTKAGWVPGELIVSQQKSFADLSHQQGFIALFFTPNDELYGYFLNVEGRGSGLNSVEQKTRLFLLAIADTTDAKIGATSAIDLAKVTETFTTLAARLGIQIFQKTLAGPSYGKRNAENAIDKWLTPKPNDIVIFYYSGHGFRYSNDVSDYPRMDLRTTDDIDANNLSIEAVFNRIKKKNAKVNIIIGDCCNDDIKRTSPEGRLPLRGRGATGAGEIEINLANCRTLFFPDHQVSFIATASDKAQLALGNPKLGGFFTNFFIANLSRSIFGYEANPSWFSIITKTRESTRRQSLTALCDAARCVQIAVSNVTPLQ